MSKLIRRRRAKATTLAGLALSLAAATSVALVASEAQADTPPSYVVAVADAGVAQVNVPAGGTISGLVDGLPVQVDANATGAGNQVTLLQLRVCRDGSTIESFDEFRPTTAGQCSAPSIGFAGSAGETFQEYQPDDFPAFQHVGGPIKAPSGSSASAVEGEQPIVCTAAQGCELYARVVAPQNAAGDVYLHWELKYAGQPGAPTGLVATPGDSSASIALTAPADTGNATLSSYVVEVTPANGALSPFSFETASATGPIAVTGLTNGELYHVSVSAKNTAADGTTHFTGAAASVDVTPQVAPPAISSLSPTSGPTAGGNNVTITGTNLLNASGVSFGGSTAAIVSTTATQIVATAPAHAAGTVDVAVTTPGGTSANTNADNYTYVAPVPPSITSISPKQGPIAGGTTVTINGQNLQGATSVTIGGTAATITSNTATQIKVTTPEHAAGKVDIVVTNANGSSANTAADDFTYTAPSTNPLQPLIDAINALLNSLKCGLNPASCA